MSMAIHPSKVITSRLERVPLIKQLTQMYELAYTELWTMSWDGKTLIHDSEACSIGKAFANLADFHRVSRRFTFRQGCGLPGRVWDSKVLEVQRSVQMMTEIQFHRKKAAAKAKLNGVLGVPVFGSMRQLLGVLVSFQHKCLESNASSLFNGMEAVAHAISPGLEFEGVDCDLVSSNHLSETGENDSPEQHTHQSSSSRPPAQVGLCSLNAVSAGRPEQSHAPTQQQLQVANSLLALMPQKRSKELSGGISEPQQVPTNSHVPDKSGDAESEARDGDDRNSTSYMFTEYTTKNTSQGVVLQTSNTSEQATNQIDEANMVLAACLGI